MLIKELLQLVESPPTDELYNKYYSYIPIDDFKKIVSVDPTKEKKYFKWIITNVYKTDKDRIDIELTYLLDLFDKHKNQLPVKDIGRIGSVDELSDIINNTKEKIKVLYKGSEWQIETPTSYEESCQMYDGKATWCTRDTRNKDHYEAYTSGSNAGTLYVFRDKNNTLFQLHVPFNKATPIEFKDHKNVHVSGGFFNWVQKHPELKDYFVEHKDIFNENEIRKLSQQKSKADDDATVQYQNYNCEQAFPIDNGMVTIASGDDLDDMVRIFRPLISQGRGQTEYELGNYADALKDGYLSWDFNVGNLNDYKSYLEEYFDQMINSLHVKDYIQNVLMRLYNDYYDELITTAVIDEIDNLDNFIDTFTNTKNTKDIAEFCIEQDVDEITTPLRSAIYSGMESGAYNQLVSAFESFKDTNSIESNGFIEGEWKVTIPVKSFVDYVEDYKNENYDEDDIDESNFVDYYSDEIREVIFDDIEVSDLNVPYDGFNDFDEAAAFERFVDELPTYHKRNKNPNQLDLIPNKDNK